MSVASLQDICARFLASNFDKFNIDVIKRLPHPVINHLGFSLSPINLRRLEVVLNTPLDENQETWLSQYAKFFGIYYQRMFKVTPPSENLFCVVSKSDRDYRRIFLEDHFHTLVEDASLVTMLMQRGAKEIDVHLDRDGNEKICIHVKMEQIKCAMLICAPFVKSLRIFRSKILASPQFKEVLSLLTQSVVCLRLVFLHDYRIMRDTLDYFVKHGNILDLHTIWQPQNCSLPPKYSIDILTLIAGLQLPRVDAIDDEPIDDDDELTIEEEAIAWNPYDMYDYAVLGANIDSLATQCAAVQAAKSATHISISSFLLTQNMEVHKFIAETLMPRWVSLQSLKLSSLNNFDINVFLPSILNLIATLRLRQLCFEDTQFLNPMNLFIEVLRILLRHDDIVMNKLTMIGIGHPFEGNFSTELSPVDKFNGIRILDVSFSTLRDTTSTSTFAEYIKRDQALRSLNLNCCKLTNGESTAFLLRSIGESGITKLILDYNQLSGEVVENALVYMLTKNNKFETFSISLCSLGQTFLRTGLLPALGTLPYLNQLYIAENKIGAMVELKDMLIKLLSTRHLMDRLDISSNCLNGAFLKDVARTLVQTRGTRILFNGLNISFNMAESENECDENADHVRETFTSLSGYLNCMMRYVDDEENLEHVAQM